MTRNLRLVVALVAALVLAGTVWITQGHDPVTPTAAAPRGAFASDRASEEPPLPSR